MLVLGILLPGGIGAVSYGILMGTITPRLSEKIRTAAAGMVNAAEKPAISTSELFRSAFMARDYIFVMLAFFACGIHMALIANHFLILAKDVGKDTLKDV